MSKFRRSVWKLANKNPQLSSIIIRKILIFKDDQSDIFQIIIRKNLNSLANHSLALILRLYPLFPNFEIWDHLFIYNPALAQIFISAYFYPWAVVIELNLKNCYIVDGYIINRKSKGLFYSTAKWRIPFIKLWVYIICWGRWHSISVFLWMIEKINWKCKVLSLGIILEFADRFL